MNITFVTTFGITRDITSWPEPVQARGLIANGHRVRFYTYLPKKGFTAKDPFDARIEEIDGITVRRLTRRDWWSFDLIRAFWRDVIRNRERPDIIYIWHLKCQFAFLTCLIAKILRIKVIFAPIGPYHDPYFVDDVDRPYDAPPHYDNIVATLPQLVRYLWRERKPKRAIKNYLTHAPLRLADHIITLSEDERRVLAKMGVLMHKSSFVPCGIDADWLEREGVYNEAESAIGKRYGTPQILYLSQFKYRKGFDILLRTMPTVLERYPDAVFVFAGHSPIEREDLIRLARALGVYDHIVLPGQVSDADKGRLWLHSDVYAFPTRYESFGIPLIEAQSAGCAIVTTNLPAVDETIQHEFNGLLTTYNDPADLAAAIIRLLDDPALRRRLAANGRESVRRFYTPQVVKDLEAVYTAVVKR